MNSRGVVHSWQRTYLVDQSSLRDDLCVAKQTQKSGSVAYSLLSGDNLNDCHGLS